MKWRKFRDLDELLDHLITKTSVAYQAPLDTGVGSFIVKSVIIFPAARSTSMVKVWNRETKTLTLNLADHFDRFRTISKDETP